MTVRALVFDAYGTLYDVQSVLAKAEALCPGKGEVITQIWRLKQLEYTWLRSLMQEYEDFWEVTGAALDFALRAAGVEPNDAIRGPADGELSPPRSLSRSAARRSLRSRDASSPSCRTAARECSKNSSEIPGSTGGSRPRSASTASVHTSRTRPVMRLVEPALGVPKEEVLFVSSNSFDVVGAKAFGFEVAWIRRTGGGASATMFGMLRGRAEELGHAPDHTVSALTDLPELLRVRS